MRTIACLSMGLLLAFSACRKPKPSLEYTEASGAYSTLVAKLGDDAYADAEMTRIEELLAKVPSDSLDATAAADLKKQIQAERKRIADEAAEHEKTLRGLAEVDVPSAPDRPNPEPSAAEDSDAGVASAEIVAGMSIAELKKVSEDCFASSGGLKLRNPDKTMVDGEMFERVDSGRCREKYPRHANRLLIFRDGKLVANYDKSELKREPMPPPEPPQAPPPGAAGAGGGPGATGQPAPAPAPAPAAPPAPPPGGAAPPESPGEQTGPGQTAP